MKKIKIFLPNLGDCEITPQCDQCVYSFGVYSTMDGIKVKCKKCGAELPIHRITKRKKEMNNQIFYLNGGGDEQYTPRKTVEMILPHIQHWKEKIIWCPFDTEDSEFVKVLKTNGFNVVFSHIDLGQDFFTYEPEHFDVILSNPPYKNKRDFIQRAESFNKPWCLLLPINIISDAILNDFFGDMAELTILVPKKRTRFFNKKTGEIGKQPTFKACFIGRNFFKKQLIGVNE